MSALPMFFGLISAHAVCDYPLQGDFLAKAKNRLMPIPGVPWWQALGAHAAIHGGAVALVTGVWWLGLAEAAAHFVIDDLKCSGRLGSGARAFNLDQIGHLICKAAWVAIAVSVSA